MSMEEHYGSKVYNVEWRNLSMRDFESSQNKIRTAPLWGVRMGPRLMHDGATLTLTDAIQRHGGEAKEVTARFHERSQSDGEALLEFLRSL